MQCLLHRRNPSLPFQPYEWTPVHHHYRTQIYQLLSTISSTRSLSRNVGLLVSYTNYQTPPQTTSAANLRLHTNLFSNLDTLPISASINPQIPPSPSGTKQFPVFCCWGRPLWSGWKYTFSFVSSLYNGPWMVISVTILRDSYFSSFYIKSKAYFYQFRAPL